MRPDRFAAWCRRRRFLAGAAGASGSKPHGKLHVEADFLSTGGADNALGSALRRLGFSKNRVVSEPGLPLDCLVVGCAGVADWGGGDGVSARAASVRCTSTL